MDRALPRRSFCLLSWIGLAALLASCASVLPRHAPPAAVDLESVLDAHARAHGLSRDGQLPGAMHTRAEVEALGFLGTLETWSEPPLSTWARMDLGAIALETGFDGSAGWIRDRNGAVRSTSGHESAGMLMDALLTTGAYVLRQPPVPLHRELVDEDGDPATLEVALRLPQREAAPMILAFDARNFRLLRTTWDNGQSVDVTQYHDYRREGGRLLAHRVQMSYGPTATLLATVSSVERTAPRGPRAYAHPEAEAMDDVRFRPGTSSASLAMEPGFDHILLRARVNGRHEGLFLLDSGAGSNVVHAGRLRELGLSAVGTAEATGATGTAAAQFVAIDSLELGGLVARHQSWVTLDLTKLEAHFGPRLLGVLGYDLLQRVVTEVDYDRRVVHFHARAAWIPPADGVRLPVRMQQNVPAVQARVEGIEAWLHLDTGSDNTLDLTTHFVQAHGMLDDRADLQPVLTNGVGGTAQAQRGLLRTLELAGVTFEQLPCTFNSAREGVLGGEVVSGVLGAGVLSRFHCAFDYAGNCVWLVPRQRLP